MSESDNSALSINDAATVFADIIEPQENEEQALPESEPSQDEGEPVETTETEAEAESPETKVFTIKVDGKDVEVTEDQLADAYKNGLRQSDYTKKTMEAAELRKAAEAEIEQARQERSNYAQQVAFYEQALQQQLAEQSQTDWANLLENDPVEYLKQQHLFQQRQATLQQAQQELSTLAEYEQADSQQRYMNFLQGQQQELLAKIPAWKDESVQKAEKAELKEFLKEQGLSDSEISNIADHRAVLIARQAMQFAKLLKSSPDATKRVQSAPQKVERPGNRETNPLDGRNRAMQKLGKTGRIEDAAAVFAALI